MHKPTTAGSPHLTAGTLEAYRAQGYLVLRGMFSSREIETLRVEAARLANRIDLIDSDNIRCRWSNHCETDECRFDCFDPVIDLSEVCAQVARDPRIVSVVSALYGEPANLFKDKLIFKPPGAKGYALHQDYIAWESFPRSFTTVIVAIDAADATNGATEVFAGLHTQGCLTPADGQYHELSESVVAGRSSEVLELHPGDVAVFSGYTPHRSGPNKSTKPRRLLYLSYNAASDGGDCRQAHYAEFKEWLKERYAEYGKVNTFFR